MKNGWDDEKAKGMSDFEMVVYASQLMGAESGLVIVSGGNSSVRLTEPDPISREPVLVTYVKGSGSDMNLSAGKLWTSNQ